VSGRLPLLCEGDTAAMTEPTRPATVDGDALVLYAGDSCTAMGSANRDYLGRARRQLEASRSYQLANELWTGATAAAADPDLANRSLAAVAAESDTLTAAPASEADAMGCLEAGLADALRGQQGMVHVTPQLLIHLVGQQLVVREGTLWTTPMGHIVVADAGYDGSGPGGVAAGASQWAYATPLVYVRTGPVQTLPDNLDDARGWAEALNRGVNDVLVWAYQLAGYRWASHCAHLAVEVDLATCAIGGGA
jgi:hypothetical protein